jgi:hypothetical protein
LHDGCCRRCRYLSDELMAANLVLSALPMPLTPATITMLMPAAMMQYSIAVAPDSFLKNSTNNRRIEKTPADASPRESLAPCSERNLICNDLRGFEEQDEQLIKPEMAFSPVFIREGKFGSDSIRTDHALEEQCVAETQFAADRRINEYLRYLMAALSSRRSEAR